MEWSEVLEAVRGFEVPPEVAFAGLLAAVCLIFIVGVRVQLRRLQALLEEAREFVDKAKEDRRKDEGLERILMEARLMGVDEQGKIPRRPSSFLASELQMDRVGAGLGTIVKQDGQMVPFGRKGIEKSYLTGTTDLALGVSELRRSRLTDAELEAWARMEEDAREDARVNPF